MSENNYYQGSGGESSGKKPLSNKWKALIIVILSILIISPIDIIPGDAATIVGLIDDLGYIAGIIGTVATMIKSRRQRYGGDNEQKYNDVDKN